MRVVYPYARLRHTSRQLLPMREKGRSRGEGVFVGGVVDKRMWADLIEPVGGAGKAVGGGARKGWLSVARAAEGEGGE